MLSKLVTLRCTVQATRQAEESQRVFDAVVRATDD